jgi:hypothetical protein
MAKVTETGIALIREMEDSFTSTIALHTEVYAGSESRLHTVTIDPRGNLTAMTDLSRIVGQLKKERARVQQQLSGLNAALAAFAGVYSGRGPSKKRTRHPLSAKGRAAIRRAQKARWAKVRAEKKSPEKGK